MIEQIVEYALIDITFFSVMIILYLSVTVAVIMTGIRKLKEI